LGDVPSITSTFGTGARRGIRSAAAGRPTLTSAAGAKDPEPLPQAPAPRRHAQAPVPTTISPPRRHSPPKGRARARREPRPFIPLMEQSAIKHAPGREDAGSGRPLGSFSPGRARMKPKRPLFGGRSYVPRRSGGESWRPAVSVDDFSFFFYAHIQAPRPITTLDSTTAQTRGGGDLERQPLRQPIEGGRARPFSGSANYAPSSLQWRTTAADSVPAKRGVVAFGPNHRRRAFCPGWAAARTFFVGGGGGVGWQGGGGGGGGWGGGVGWWGGQKLAAFDRGESARGARRAARSSRSCHATGLGPLPAPHA